MLECVLGLPLRAVKISKLNPLPARNSPMAVWKVKAVNAENNRMEAVDGFKKGRLDVLGMSETNVMEEWEGVKCARAGVGDRERCREGVTL